MSSQVQQNGQKQRYTAVITGAGGGLGTAIAKELSSRYHVALIDINVEGVQKLASSIGSDKASAYTCDITNPSSVSQVASEILKLGPVALLVNNAGHAFVDSLHESTPESWSKEVSLNLDAAFYCFKAFEESLKTTPGANVVNIASVNGLTTVGNPAYSAAKAGMISFTAAIATEYAQYGMRANAVAPGSVRTSAWDERLERDPSAMDKVLQWYPLKTPILPTHIAKTVAFLSSEDAGAITGVCLPVDAGLTCGSSLISRAVTNSEYFK